MILLTQVHPIREAVAKLTGLASTGDNDSNSLFAQLRPIFHGLIASAAVDADDGLDPFILDDKLIPE